MEPTIPPREGRPGCVQAERSLSGTSSTESFYEFRVWIRGVRREHKKYLSWYNLYFIQCSLILCEEYAEMDETSFALLKNSVYWVWERTS